MTFDNAKSSRRVGVGSIRCQMSRADPIGDLVQKVVGGDAASVARALSIVVDESRGFEELLRALFAHSGRSHKIGLTGPPGSGKSSLLRRLLPEYRSQGLRIAVLAVDPSSPVTGGAFLGDRLRFQGEAPDPEVFARSLASRGAVGGVTGTIFNAVHTLEAWGADILFIETVGTGQDEVSIAKVADTVAYVTTPSLGDDIQAMKAGMMEMADVFVVNKSDLSGAGKAVADLKSALSLGSEGHKGLSPAVVAACASTGEGLPALVEALGRHREGLSRSGEGARRRRAQAVEELSLFVSRRVYRDVLHSISEGDIRLLMERKRDPVQLARKYLRR